MAKNLVICSDGTGNTFDSRVTNVTRLVKNLVLDQPERQLVIYDQGLGTTKKREEVTRISQDEGLRILEAPLSSSGINPIGWVNKTRGLAFGYGLEENIRQMYRVLAEVIRGRGPSVPVRVQPWCVHGAGPGRAASSLPPGPGNRSRDRPELRAVLGAVPADGG